jgi:hypothetical protein
MQHTAISHQMHCTAVWRDNRTYLVGRGGEGPTAASVKWIRNSDRSRGSDRMHSGTYKMWNQWDLGRIRYVILESAQERRSEISFTRVSLLGPSPHSTVHLFGYPVVSLPNTHTSLESNRPKVPSSLTTTGEAWKTTLIFLIFTSRKMRYSSLTRPKSLNIA